MAEFGESSVSEQEAQKFQQDRDERVNKIREEQGLPPRAEVAVEEETEIETPEVETAEEVPVEESEEEEAEEEIEEESGEEETDTQPPDKTVFRQLNVIRSQKREAEALQKETLEKLNAVLEENASLKANLPPPQPFVDFAKAKGIQDPKEVKDMYDLFRDELAKDLGSKVGALEAKIQGFEEMEQKRQEAGALQESMGKLRTEWSEIAPFIESEYKPTAEQSEKAFELMAELAHDERYHDKEVDYILFKEASQFENIFGARKRRTMFPSRGRAATDSVKTPVKRDGSHESIMAMKRERDAIKAGGDGFTTIKDSEI